MGDERAAMDSACSIVKSRNVPFGSSTKGTPACAQSTESKWIEARLSWEIVESRLTSGTGQHVDNVGGGRRQMVQPVANKMNSPIESRRSVTNVDLFREGGAGRKLPLERC